MMRDALSEGSLIPMQASTTATVADSIYCGMRTGNEARVRLPHSQAPVQFFPCHGTVLHRWLDYCCVIVFT